DLNSYVCCLLSVQWLLGKGNKQQTTGESTKTGYHSKDFGLNSVERWTARWAFVHPRIEFGAGVHSPGPPPEPYTVHRTQPRQSLSNLRREAPKPISWH